MPGTSHNAKQAVSHETTDLHQSHSEIRSRLDDALAPPIERRAYGVHASVAHHPKYGEQTSLELKVGSLQTDLLTGLAQ